MKMPNMFSRRLWTRDYVLILLLCAIATITNSIFISVLPVYVLDLGGTNAHTGMMMSGLTIVGIITRLATASLMDRIGRKKLLVVGSGLYAVNALLFCFTKDLNVIFTLRVIHGFTQGIFFPVSPTIVSDISPADLLVDAMGFFGVSSSIMFGITPSIGLSIYRNLGATALFMIATMAAVISFALALQVKEHYTPQPVSAQEKKSMPVQKISFKVSVPFLMLVIMPSMANMFLYIANSSVNNFLAPCGISRGMPQINLYFIVNYAVVIFVRLTIGRFILVVSENICIFNGIIFYTIGTIIIAFADSMPLMLLSAVICGFGYTAVYQLLQVQVIKNVSQNKRGLANSAYMLLTDIGNGIGAALWGSVSDVAGYTVTYICAGISTMFGFATHSAYLKYKRANSENYK